MILLSQHFLMLGRLFRLCYSYECQCFLQTVAPAGGAAGGPCSGAGAACALLRMLLLARSAGGSKARAAQRLPVGKQHEQNIGNRVVRLPAHG